MMSQTSTNQVDWIPAFAPETMLAIGFAIVVGLFIAAWWLPSRIHRGRWGMRVLRTVAIIAAGFILVGPTVVRFDETPPDRAPMAILIDGSQSMTFAEDGGRRWDQSIAAVGRALSRAGSASRGVDLYSFGRRLRRIDDAAVASGDVPICPSDSATRLADALWRIERRHGLGSSDGRTNADRRKRLSGVVLISDGRASRLGQSEDAARRLAAADVPIHAVPIGRPGGGGDIAIASVSVPQKARKFARVPIELFVRSFGIRADATVRIFNRDRPDDPPLLETPVALSGGPQAVSMRLPVDDSPLKLRIAITADDDVDELSDVNNAIDADIGIDRAKIRVLYIEGAPASGAAALFGTPSGNAVEALARLIASDVDVQCAAFAPSFTAGTFRALDRGNYGFPDDRAAMYAFDLIVISNVSLDRFTAAQAAWIADAVSDRGGGLWLCGTTTLATSRWNGTPLEPLLPFAIGQSNKPSDNSGSDGLVRRPIVADSIDHPVWKSIGANSINVKSMPAEGTQAIRATLPDTAAAMLPDTAVPMRPIQPRGVATILARSRSRIKADRDKDQSVANPLSGGPAMLVADRGRGRVFASSVAIGGAPGQTLINAWSNRSSAAVAKFVRNLVFYSTERSFVGRQRLVVQTDRRFYRGGDAIRLSATVFDTDAKPTSNDRVWAMLLPASMDDTSLFSPVVWPDAIVRESGETHPMIAWGEEFPIPYDSASATHSIALVIDEGAAGSGDGHFVVEASAFQGDAPETEWSHGTQIDSVSLDVRVMNDPFELRNPLPNHELMERLATITGGRMIQTEPSADEAATEAIATQIADLIRDRPATPRPPVTRTATAWDRWWWYAVIAAAVSAEWIWRRKSGMA